MWCENVIKNFFESTISAPYIWNSCRIFDWLFTRIFASSFWANKKFFFESIYSALNSILLINW
jgi:hypothetical protein